MPPEARAATDLKQEMAARISRAFEAWENRPDVAELKINRLVLPMNPVDPLDWLSSQVTPAKVYWSGREDDQETAGTGQADLIVGSFRDHPDALIARCRSYLSENPGLRYFGGFAFQEEGSDAGWQKFGPSRFHIPRFEVIRTGDSSAFVCNLIFRRSQPMQQSDILAELDELVFPFGVKHPQVRITERVDYPASLFYRLQIGKHEWNYHHHPVDTRPMISAGQRPAPRINLRNELPVLKFHRTKPGNRDALNFRIGEEVFN